MKYIKKLIRNSKRALNQQVIKNKQEIVKYAPRLTGIQVFFVFRGRISGLFSIKNSPCSATH